MSTDIRDQEMQLICDALPRLVHFPGLLVADDQIGIVDKHQSWLACANPVQVGIKTPRQIQHRQRHHSDDEQSGSAANPPSMGCRGRLSFHLHGQFLRRHGACNDTRAGHVDRDPRRARLPLPASQAYQDAPRRRSGLRRASERRRFFRVAGALTSPTVPMPSTLRRPARRPDR